MSENTQVATQNTGAVAQNQNRLKNGGISKGLV